MERLALLRKEMDEIDRELTRVFLRRLDVAAEIGAYKQQIGLPGLDQRRELQVIRNASAEQIVGLLDRFVGDNKEAFLASLINQNQKTIISAIEDAAQKQNIRLKINSILLEV